MVDQLRLFPEAETAESAPPDPLGEANAIDELLTVARHLRNGPQFRALLAFISRFPQYSPLNGLLLYLQNPAITHVATANIWSKRHGRQVRYGARPLAILAPMGPVVFVYDVTDTEGQPVVSAPDSGRRLAAGDILAHLRHNCGVHGVAVRPAAEKDVPAAQGLPLNLNARRQYADLSLDARANYLILTRPGLGPGEEIQALTTELAHLFCGHYGIDDQSWWPDRRNIDPRQATVEADAITWLVCGRAALPAHPDTLTSLSDPSALPVFSLHAVLQATQYIEEMGRANWQQPRRASRYGGGQP
jgi:hypothetical protein